MFVSAAGSYLNLMTSCVKILDDGTSFDNGPFELGKTQSVLILAPLIL